MQNKITNRILRANVSFFDQNPIGKILQVFSNDMMIFDLVVPIVALITIQGFFYTGTVVVLIAIINPWMLVIIAVCMVLLYLILKKGSKVMIEAQKQDA